MEPMYEKIKTMNFNLIKNLSEALNLDDLSWDDLHLVIDEINAIGKEVNFSIYKTYCSLTVENGGKFVKNYSYAHSEYVTSEQTSKEAVFNLIKHFYVKFIEINLVEQ